MTIPHNSLVLLPTAIVHVQTSSGYFVEARALCDTGAQGCLITTSTVVDIMNVAISPSSIPVRGIGNIPAIQARGTISLTFKPVYGTQPLISTSAMVVDVIAGLHPEIDLPEHIVSSTAHLPLADPYFYKSGPIDILLGADVFGSLLRSEKNIVLPSGLLAFSTIFDFVLSGPINGNLPLVESIMTGISLSQVVEKFWRIEEAPQQPPPISNPLDDECEAFFKRTTTRLPDGRFQVRLPFLPDRPPLGDSRSAAVRRFLNLEKRLQANPAYKEKYVAFMREYLTLGHMSLAVRNPLHNEHYFIPHHGVFKASDVPKIRVVFDGSNPTTSGVSLNQCLHTGPKLQRDISHILLNFRRHAVVFVTDIKMMFRMSWVHPEDRRFQLVLWRESPAEPLQTYELNTTTYGLRSSPFIAIRVLLELAELERATFPKAAAVLETDIYVDDCLTGASSLEEARILKTELEGIMASGGFELRKWISNVPELLSDLPADHLQLPHSFQDPDNPQTIAVLGVQYTPETDSFTYRNSYRPEETVTKRKVLSLIARMYDPCGWIAPLIFKAKVFIQRLWLSGLSWDEPLNQALALEWSSFTSDLVNVPHFQIPRLIFPPGSNSFTLHGFSDASEAGFAAAVYLRTEDPNGNCSVHLLMSKSKVAPVRTHYTIPKLELLGAWLLSKLTQHVALCLQKTIVLSAIYSWTDSRIVLAWIRTPPHQLQTFEANRVSQIINSDTPSEWRHVPGHLNPSDCASRGLSASALAGNSLWWSPAWLAESQSCWPTSEIRQETDGLELPGLRCLVVSLSPVIPDASFLIEKYGSLNKLVTVLAYIRRFLHNSRHVNDRISSPFLTYKERNDATLHLVRITQQEHFSAELGSLQRGEIIKSPLRRLTPFIDSQGLIRVGGRLSHSDLPYSTKHPLLLPKDGHFVKLLISHHHIFNCHAGANALQAILCRRYWILSARRVIQHVIFKCLRCYRLKAITSQPPMGDLPRDRVSAVRAFDGVGTDFAGPFYTKIQSHRNRRIVKSYLCVFVCLSTKAVHLEVVSDLTTDAFIAALTRFVSRRGVPSLIRSDNGRNYVGANNYLKDLYSFLAQNATSIGSELSKQGITWTFDPPICPHWGGIFEAAVKSAKTHLKRVIGETPLTFEELTTVFTKIEAVLNSRPLCSMSSRDPNNLEVLSPGHFLIGQPLTALPEHPYSDVKLHRLTRFQLVQQITQHFWNRWRSEYLSTLQARNKWTAPDNPPCVGELVLLKDDNTPPLEWRRGRIVELYPGSDGVVRVVAVKTPSSTLKRSITKLVRLPID